MWSGPRNISTAMMRSFSSRPDCAVSDEPFYGCFLKATGADHPMREAVIGDMDCDWHSVAATLAGPAPGGEPPAPPLKQIEVVRIGGGWRYALLSMASAAAGVAATLALLR